MPSDRAYRVRRIRRHVGLGLASVALTVAMSAIVPSPNLVFRLSMGSAYAGLALVGISLAIGPWNVVRRKPNPVSTDLRRDIGIWAAVVALFHVGVGLQVHMRSMWEYFFYLSGGSPRLPIRRDAFGLANYTGLAVTVILVVMLATSNHLSLRSIGARRWKAIHRSIYVGFPLLVVHGALYQLLERRQLPFVLLFGAMSVLIVVVQLVGAYRSCMSARRS